MCQGSRGDNQCTQKCFMVLKKLVRQKLCGLAVTKMVENDLGELWPFTVHCTMHFWVKNGLSYCKLWCSFRVQF